MTQKTFSFKKLKDKLSFYAKNDINVCLTGLHGTGKTSLITEVFNETFGPDKWLYFSGSLIDPYIELLGVPREVTDSQNRAVLDFVLPRKIVERDIHAIFIDEINRAKKPVRNALMELIQFKSVNGFKLSNLKAVWSGINPFGEDELEQSYDVEQLDPAQFDRFQVQIELPYQADLNYFSKKYGKEWGKSAIEWWDGLSDKIRGKVSPRRLDYALDIHKMGGDAFDVLPIESNPAKLITTLEVGNIEDKLKQLLDSADSDEARHFMAVENNFQSSIPFIVKNMEMRRFFLPKLTEERLTSLFFKNDDIQKYILKNPLFFKETLNEIEGADACHPNVKAQIMRALKSVDGFELFDEENKPESTRKQKK